MASSEAFVGILNRHRVELVRTIQLNGALWDELLSRGIVSREVKERIEVSGTTSTRFACTAHYVHSNQIC